MCSCRVLYSVKFNLRAKCPRDFVDMLLSWKHFPNITVSDYARWLTRHANCRQPMNPHSQSHEERLLHPSPENRKKEKFRVNLPWLKHRKEEEDKDYHLMTGSSDRLMFSISVTSLVLLWRTKQNSQCVEQLFSGMCENNYKYAHAICTHLLTEEYLASPQH